MGVNDSMSKLPKLVMVKFPPCKSSGAIRRERAPSTSERDLRDTAASGRLPTSLMTGTSKPCSVSTARPILNASGRKISSFSQRAASMGCLASARATTLAMMSL